MSSAKCNIHTATTTLHCSFGSFFFCSSRKQSSHYPFAPNIVSVIRRRIHFFSVVDVIHVQFVYWKKILFERTFTVASENWIGRLDVIFLETISVACTMITFSNRKCYRESLITHWLQCNECKHLPLNFIIRSSTRHWSFPRLPFI